MASCPGMSGRATSSDQRSPRDKLAASSILSGGIRRGSSFLKPPRNLGVGTKMVMPRRSAAARNGRCGESGLTLMAVALFHGSMSRSRAAATWAPTKFGMRPCGGNGKRATPSALNLSQTHCRAALLSAKSRAMPESGAARPGDSQGAICFNYRKYLSRLHERLGEAHIDVERAFEPSDLNCSRSLQTACSFGRFPHIDDSLALAEAAQRDGIMLAPGTVFRCHLFQSIGSPFPTYTQTCRRIGRGGA